MERRGAASATTAHTSSAPPTASNAAPTATPSATNNSASTAAARTAAWSSTNGTTHHAGTTQPRARQTGGQPPSTFTKSWRGNDTRNGSQANHTRPLVRILGLRRRRPRRQRHQQQQSRQDKKRRSPVRRRMLQTGTTRLRPQRAAIRRTRQPTAATTTARRRRTQRTHYRIPAAHARQPSRRHHYTSTRRQRTTMPKRRCLDCRQLYDRDTTGTWRCPRCQPAATAQRQRRVSSSRRGLGWAFTRRKQADASYQAATRCQCPGCPQHRGPCGEAFTLVNPKTAGHVVARSRGGSSLPILAVCRCCNSSDGGTLSRGNRKGR